MVVMMMMRMVMMMMMMMVMRGRLWCWRGGRGRWWGWGGWFSGGRPIPRPGSTLCASLRGRHAHGHFTRTILYANLQEKWPGTPPGTSFCVSLRRRNAHGHFTRAILCGNLRGKCRTPRIPPRLNTEPYLNCYSKSPSVWPHCWGNTYKYKYIHTHRYIYIII